MRRQLLFVLFVAAGLATWGLWGAVWAQAAVLVADSFLSGGDAASGEYTPGDLVPQNPTVSTFSAPWADGLTTTTSGTFDAVGTGLTWADFGAAGGAVVFQHAESLANVQAAIRPFTNAATYPDGVYYMAGLMSFDASFSTATTSLAMTGLLNAEEGDPGVFYPLGSQWGFRGSGSGVDAVFRARSTSGSVITDVVASNIAPGTHLFVVKVESDYTGTSPDRVTIWFDPTVGGPETITVPTLVKDYGNMLDPTEPARTVKNVVFRATDVGAGATVGYDEVRFAEQWGEVMPVTSTNTAYLRQGVDGYEHLGAGIRGHNDNNYGSVDELLVGSDGYTKGHFRSVLAFDTSAVPDDMIVTDVELTFTVKRTSIATTTGNIELRTTDPIVDMVEGEVTWNKIRTGTNWSNGGGDPEEAVLSSIAEPGAGDVVTFHATSALIAAAQAAVDGDELLELVLMAPDAETLEATRNFIGLYSDDAANPYHRPLLKISYVPVPEPSALALLLGAAGMLLVRWRAGRA